MERLIRKKITYLIALIILGFLILNVLRDWETVYNTLLGFDSKSLLLIFLVLGINYFINILSWYFLLRFFGINLPVQKSFRIWIYSNLARFIPGKIWQYPSRIYLLQKEKVSLTQAGTATVAEILFNLSFGAITIYISLFFWRLPLSLSYVQNKTFYLFFAPLPLLVLLLTNRSFLSWSTRIIKKLSGKNLKIKKTVHIFPKWSFLLATSFLLRFIFPGTVLFLLTKTLVPLNISLLPAFIGLFSLSWIAGYIAPFAPAGLGVTEFSLATGLSYYMPFGLSSIIAILFRVLIILSELAFVLFFNSKKIRRVFSNLPH